MELKPGYKQTEVGVIPEGWGVIPIGKVVRELRSGVSVNSTEISTFEHANCILKTSCVEGGKFYPVESKQIIYSDLARAKLNPTAGSIIISRMNTPALVGECGYVDKYYPNLYLPDRLWLASPGSDSAVSFKWLSYILSFGRVAKDIKDSASGTSNSMKNISQDAFLKVKIPFPPTKAEQEAIAKALSDMDALIQSLEQQIVKKQRTKQGVMQSLISGKLRVKEFCSTHEFSDTSYDDLPRDWYTKVIGDVIETCTSGATPYRGNKSFYKGYIPWITSGELKYCTVYETNEKISEEARKSANLKIHPPGTFLMAITGLEAEGTRGACGIVGIPATTNQSCMAIYPKKGLLDTRFLYHWYLLNGDRLALEYCQGTKQLSYTASLVRKIPITLPSNVHEQKAIAKILDDMDLEIANLQLTLTKRRILKQGMMQNLLTGTVRLV